MRKFYLPLLLLLSIVVVMPSCTGKPIDDDQKELPEPKPESQFEFVVTNKTELSYTLSILPKDKEMEYMYITDTAEYFESHGLTTPEQIIANDLKIIQEEAQAFEMTVEELVRAYYINVGDITDLTIQGIPPGEEFVVYAYGVAIEDGMPVATTPLEMLRDTTLSSTPVEQPMSVVVEVEGANVDITVDPLTYTGRYFAFVEPIAKWVETSNPTEEELEAAAMEMWYNTACGYLSYGFALPLIFDTFTYEGTFNAQQSLDASTDYFVAAVPIAETGVVYGYPTVVTFTTGEVGRSENNIDISVENVKPRSATVIVKTTNKDPYLLACLTKAQFGEMTDDQIIEYYIENYGTTTTIEGDLKYDMTGLEPNTDYFFVAFGYHGGVVTTDLFTCDFSTPEEVLADIQVSVNIIGYFDTEEVAALNSNYEAYTSYDALLAYEIVSTPAATEVYRALYQTAQVANVSDDQLAEVLLQSGAKSAAVVGFVSYGKDYTICAVVVDEQGHASRVCRSENISVTYENRGEAQAFIDYKHPSRASLESLVIEVAE